MPAAGARPAAPPARPAAAPAAAPRGAARQAWRHLRPRLPDPRFPHGLPAAPRETGHASPTRGSAAARGCARELRTCSSEPPAAPTPIRSPSRSRTSIPSLCSRVPRARRRAEPKRPDLRVVQTDRLPKLELAQLRSDSRADLRRRTARRTAADRHRRRRRWRRGNGRGRGDRRSGKRHERRAGVRRRSSAARRRSKANSSSTARSSSCTCSSW